jgi:hypothetical protein
MKAAIHIGVLAVAVAMLSPSLVAQWPEYPDKTIPRKADGTVNMDAPVPRAADGKPDFTGVWRGLGAPGPGRGRGNQPPPPPPAGPPVAGFRDVAQNIPGGAPMTPWAQELLKKRMARNSLDNPEAHCLPFGLVQFHTQGFPRKFVQTPKLMVILYEASSGIRQIFTDGRSSATPSRSTTVIRPAAGKATRWSSRATTSSRMAGSTSSARPSRNRAG